MKNIGLLFLIFCLSLGLSKARADNSQSDRLALSNALKNAKSNADRAKAFIGLSTYYLLLPGESQADMAAAKKYIGEARKMAELTKSDSLRARVLYVDSQIKRESGNREAGLSEINSAITLFAKIGNTDGQGEALMEKRHYFGTGESEIKERIKIVKEAVNLFIKSGNSLKIAEGYLELGDLYTFGPDLNVALEYLKKSITYFDKAKHKRTHGVYDLIGAVYSAMGLYEEGLRNGLKAVEIGENIKDSSGVMSTIYNRVGITYLYLDDYGKSYMFYQKGLSEAIKLNDNQAISIIAQNLIHLLVRYNILADTTAPFLEKVYAKYLPDDPVSKGTTLALLSSIYYTKDKKKGSDYMQRALAMDKLVREPVSEQKIIYSTAFAHFTKEKQFDLAKIYLQKYKQHRAGHLTLANNMLYYSGAYKLDSAQGNTKSSFENFRLYKAYSDSLYLQRISREVKNVTAKYDLAKKDAEIKLKTENINLLTHDNQTQKELLRISNMTRNITIVAVILLGLFLMTLYSRWKTNKQNNEIITKKNLKLEQLVSEKDWLVREIHHRVKNNLQTIMSLIESQASYLESNAKEAIKDSQHRINSMSLIHQKLYLVDNTTTINMQVYIEELVNYLVESFGRKSNISFSLDVEPVDLDVSRAVPIGLVLNEAITNAMKYAFPGDRNGEIGISLKHVTPGKVALRVADNGIGLPDRFETQDAKTLGMSLMYGLTSEIGGEIEIDGSNGTSITVNFAMPDFAARAAYP